MLDVLIRILLWVHGFSLITFGTDSSQTAPLRSRCLCVWERVVESMWWPEREMTLRSAATVTTQRRKRMFLPWFTLSTLTRRWYGRWTGIPVIFSFAILWKIPPSNRKRAISRRIDVTPFGFDKMLIGRLYPW